MYTLRQAAKATGLSYEHIRKLCLQEKIVYVKAGSKYLVNMEKLADYLNGKP
jgi:excisionase family DNA binding protein